MKLIYSENTGFQFPYWVEFTTKPSDDDLLHLMDVNEWVGDLLGNLGERWGFEKVTDSSSAPPGLNPVRIRMHHTRITYHWRFKAKEDAMLFKLKWGGL